jgi:hypothetical protein
MKKIAIILPSTFPVPAVKGGAIETLIQNIIDENEIHQQHNITIFSTFDKKAKQLSQRYLFTKFIWINRNIFYHSLNFILRVIKKLFIKSLDHLDLQLIKWDIRKNKYDLIIVEGNTTHVKSLARIIPKCKMFLHVHANIFTERTESNDLIVSSVLKIITVSNFVKAQILEFTQAKSRDVVVLNNCVNLELFNNKIENQNFNNIRKKYCINNDEIVIIFSGRIVENKGISYLVKAFNLLKPSYKLKLFIIGSFGSSFGLEAENRDDFYYELNKLVSENKSNIIFTGYINNNLLPYYLKASDIAVVPSICEEAAGLVAIEAMATGLPIVITNSGGMPEYVNQNCAIILEKDEQLIQNLASTLEKLINDKERREYMGTKGIEMAKKYSTEINYIEFTNILNLIISDK